MATHEPAIESPMTLGPEDDGRVVSAEEFASAEFLEPWLYEREGGRLVVMSPDGQRHVQGSQPWWKCLFGYLIDHPEIVEHVVPNAWVRVDDGTDRVGDIGVYLRTTDPAPPIPDRVPDLMYEVISPGRRSRDRDYVTKRGEYQRLEVREYVVSDASQRVVTVYSLAEGSYRERVLRPGEVYTTTLLPGLELAIADVFA